jgi:hypothetical protein
MNWKKLTTEEINKSIPCHRTTQMKNKSHMLVCKTHHSIVLGFITFPKDNFQSNLICFHMVATKDFAIVLDACLRFPSHLHQFNPGKKQLYLLNRWQGRPNS